jgi:hypothetical protein
MVTLSAHAAPVRPDVLLRMVSHDQNGNPVEGVTTGEAWIATNPISHDIVLVWLGVSDTFAQGGGSAKATMTNLTRSYCGVTMSRDGGRTWTANKALPFAEIAHGIGDPAAIGPVPGPHSGDRNFPICGDPALVSAPGPNGQGTVFYAFQDEIGSPDEVQVVTSSDEGYSWTDPVETFGVDRVATGSAANNGSPTIPFDRQEAAADASTGAAYISGPDDSVFGRSVTVSTDYGVTWSSLRLLDPDGQAGWGDTIAAANGLLATGYVLDQNSNRYQTTHNSPVNCPTHNGSTQPCVVFETTTPAALKDTAKDPWTRHVVAVPDVTSASSGGLTRVAVAADPAHVGHYAFAVPVAGNLEVWTTADGGTTWARSTTITPGTAPQAQRGDLVNKQAIAYSPTGALGVSWRNQHPPAPGAASDIHGQPVTTFDVYAMVSRQGGDGWSEAVHLNTNGPTIPNSSMSDDCACNIVLSATELMATWADEMHVDGGSSREQWFASFDYTKLR